MRRNVIMRRKVGTADGGRDSDQAAITRALGWPSALPIGDVFIKAAGEDDLGARHIAAQLANSGVENRPSQVELRGDIDRQAAGPLGKIRAAAGQDEAGRGHCGAHQREATLGRQRGA